MMKQQRHRHIMEMLEEKGVVAVTEIIEQLQVSGMTARRDLDELAAAGLLRRHHGGAVRSLGRAFEPPFRLRATRSSAAKDAIGQRAAQLIVTGESVGIDSGTTTLAMIPHLSTPNITIATASVRVASEVAARFALEQDLRVIMLGGVMQGDELVLTGSITEAALDGLRLDRCFIGIGGLSASTGATDYNMENARVKRKMIDVSEEVVVLVDGSKFGESAFTRICDVSRINTVVTDASAPEAEIDALRRRGVTVIVADARG